MYKKSLFKFNKEELNAMFKENQLRKEQGLNERASYEPSGR